MGNEVASHQGASVSPSHAVRGLERSEKGDQRQDGAGLDFHPFLLPRRTMPCSTRSSLCSAELPAAAAVLNGQYPFLLFASADHLIPLEAAVANSLSSSACASTASSSSKDNTRKKEQRKKGGERGEAGEHGGEGEENPLLSLLSFDGSGSFPRTEAALDVSTYNVALLREALRAGPQGRTGREKGDSLLAWPSPFPAFLPPGRAIDTNQLFVAYAVKGGVRVMPIVGSADGGVEETYKAPLYVPPTLSAGPPQAKPSAVSVALYQGTKPQFLLVSDSNNLVSIFKLAPPVSAGSRGSSGGASSFLLLQLPKPEEPLAQVSSAGAASQSVSSASQSVSSASQSMSPIYVAWVPPAAGGLQEEAAQPGREQSCGLGSTDVYFVTVQRHQVILWSLPVLRSYCISKNIKFDEQPLLVDDAVVSCCACVLPLRDAWASASELEKLRGESSLSHAGSGFSSFFASPALPSDNLPLFALPPSSSFSFSSPFLKRPAASQHPGLFADGRLSEAETLSVQAVSFCPASRSVLVAFNRRCVAAWRIEPSHNKVPRISLIGAQFVPRSPVPPGMSQVAASVLGRPLPGLSEADASASAGPSGLGAPSVAPQNEKAFNPFDAFLVQAASASSAGSGSCEAKKPEEKETRDTQGEELLSTLTAITSLNVLYATVYPREEEGGETSTGQSEGVKEKTLEADKQVETGPTEDKGRQMPFLLVGTANNSCLRVFPLFLSRQDLSANPFFPSQRPLPLLFGSAVQTLRLDAAAAPNGSRTACVGAGEDKAARPSTAGVLSELPWAFVRVDAARHAVLWSVAGCGAPQRLTREAATPEAPSGQQAGEGKPSGDAERRDGEASACDVLQADGRAGPPDSAREGDSSKDSFVFVLEVNQRMLHRTEGRAESASERDGGEEEKASLVHRAAHLPLPSMLVLPSQFPVKNISSVFSLYSASGTGARTGRRRSVSGKSSPSLSFASSSDFEAVETLGAGEVALYSFFVKQADKKHEGGKYDLVQGHSHRTLQQLYRHPSIQWASLDAFALPAAAHLTGTADAAALVEERRRGAGSPRLSQDSVNRKDDEKKETKKREEHKQEHGIEGERESRSASSSSVVEQVANASRSGIGGDREKKSEALVRPAAVSAPPLASQAGASGVSTTPRSKEEASREILMRLLGKTALPNLSSSSASSPPAPGAVSLSSAPVSAPDCGAVAEPEETRARGAGNKAREGKETGSSLDAVPSTAFGKEDSSALFAEKKEGKQKESKRQEAARKEGSTARNSSGGKEAEEEQAGGCQASPVLAAQPLTTAGEKDAFDREGERSGSAKRAAHKKAKGEERGQEKCAAHAYKQTPETKPCGGEDFTELTRPSVASLEASVLEILALLKAGGNQKQARSEEGLLALAQASGSHSETTEKDETVEKAVDEALRRLIRAVEDGLLKSLAPELAAQVAASLVSSGALPSEALRLQNQGAKSEDPMGSEKQKEMLRAVLAPVVSAELGSLFSEHVVPGLKEAVRAGLADVKAVVATKLAEVRRLSAAEVAAVDRSIQQVHGSLQQSFQRMQKQLECQAPLQRQNSLSAETVDSMRQNLAALEEGLKAQSEAVMKAVEGVSQTLVALQRQQSQYQTQVTQQLQQQQRELHAQKQKVEQVPQAFRQLRADFRADLSKTEQTLKERSEALAASAAAAAVSAALGSSPHAPGAAAALGSTTVVAAAAAGAGPSGSRSETGGDVGGAGERGESGRTRREESEEEKLKKRLLHCLQTQNFEEAFSLSIAADLQQSTGGCWLLSICSYFSPSQFFERDPLPIGQPALLGTVKILSEGLKADLRERKRAAVEQRVAWISEALFQVDGPMPQIGRSDFLDLVDEFRTNLTWAQQHVQKEGDRDRFTQPIEEGLALSLKQLKRLQRTAEASRAS
ncbi:hypothetical protein TGRUB_219710 [Toxoplasma gondii RUB]|uniref:Uncharacterized protein n=1 Tax=Toxoplasma gondii RUB TaxID=935652 RepID=A0A086M7R5_TOXGO|nr:hypothetical protein TGRUB_219710 [Toxoplasma gondii RUB]